MQTINDFSGSDIIDVRDIIARVEELRESFSEIIEEFEGQDTEEDKVSFIKNHPNTDVEEFEELDTLEKFLQSLQGYGGDEQWEGDWYPVTLIHENYFEQSMDNMVEDCYDIPKDLPSFMTITLDYDALKQDYSEVDFEGDTYYYR